MKEETVYKIQEIKEL